MKKIICKKEYDTETATLVKKFTCGALGADPRGCMILISAGALTAYMTPSATAAVAMCMGAGGYDVKALFKMGWLFALLACIVYIGFVSFAYPAF